MSISPGQIDESERRFSPEERRIAEILVREGRMVSAKAEVKHRRMGDAIIDGTLMEFKSLATTTADSETIDIIRNKDQEQKSIKFRVGIG